jgi:hypothetical protein
MEGAMPRTVEITVPSERTSEIISEIRGLDGLLSLRVQTGVSIQPPGDVVTVETTTRSLHDLVRLLDAAGVGRTSGTSITTSDPTSVISASSASPIATDTHEALWEETELTLGRESGMTANMMVVMAVSGAVATIGLVMNILHYVIAAMVIAPGFEPILRVGFGAIAGSQAWRRGLIDSGKGYLALLAGAVAAALALAALGKPLIQGEATYLPAGVLIPYWSSISPSGVLASAAAAIAGAILVATRRSVLTAGVMIALSLVPAASLVGLGVVAGDLDIAGRSLLRWLIEVGLVAGASVLVFAWKRSSVHRRRMII